MHLVKSSFIDDKNFQEYLSQFPLSDKFDMQANTCYHIMLTPSVNEVDIEGIVYLLSHSHTAAVRVHWCNIPNELAKKRLGYFKEYMLKEMYSIIAISDGDAVYGMMHPGLVFLK